jgi:SAM-dependent methyltransferase
LRLHAPENYEEGKKIGLKDAFEAFWVILKFSLSNDIYVEQDKDILDAFSDAPNFNRWIAETIHPYLGRHVLEIGAGIGNLTRVLALRRKRYVATDLDREHLERLRVRLSSRPNLTTALLDASRPEDYAPFLGQMDTVVCLNVLEHIKDDAGALRNMRAALKEDGRAIILVPEGQGIYCTLDKELGHWRRYSEEQLRDRMAEAGFVVEAMLRFNRSSRPAWWFNGKVLGRRNISRFQLKNFDRVAPLLRRVDQWLPWGPTSIIAIGRKPAGQA